MAAIVDLQWTYKMRKLCSKLNFGYIANEKIRQRILCVLENDSWKNVWNIYDKHFGKFDKGHLEQFFQNIYTVQNDLRKT